MLRLSKWCCADINAILLLELLGHSASAFLYGMGRRVPFI